MQKNKIDSCSTVFAKKLVILKVIDDIGGKNEVWVKELENKVNELHPDIKSLFGLNYKKNSIYKSLDGMVAQNLILKYKKERSNVHSYVRISKLGLDALENFGKIFDPSKNRKNNPYKIIKH